jgi:hypothetical protein
VEALVPDTIEPSGFVLALGIYGFEGWVVLVVMILWSSFVSNLPLIVIAFMLRRRLEPSLIAVLLACGFAVVGAWKMGPWPWRHGVLMAVRDYVLYLAPVAVMGWVVGRLIAATARVLRFHWR